MMDRLFLAWLELTALARDVKGRVFGRPAPSPSDATKSAETIRRLAECREPSEIRAIVPELRSCDDLVAEAAASAVSRLLSILSPEEILRLDRSVRTYRAFGTDIFLTWSEVRPAELAQWVGPGEVGRHLLRFTTLHANGYLRAEALQRLERSADGGELPFILIRLNDWVPEVRRTAGDALRDRIKPDYVRHFVRNLALLDRLERTRRADHAPLLASVAQLLLEPMSRPFVIEGLSARSRAVRRSAFRILTSRPTTDTVELIQIALRSDDEVLRSRAAQLAEASISAVELVALLPVLSSDRSPDVRKAALRITAKVEPKAVRTRLIEAVFDRNGGVRDEARSLLKGFNDVNIPELYRHALTSADADRLGTAIFGLGETGAPGDVASVSRFLTHGISRVRRAAVKTVMKLGGEPYAPSVAPSLLDPTTSVSSQARRVLSPHAAVLGGASLWELFVSARRAEPRQNVLRLLNHLPKWDAIPCLIRASAEQDAEVSDAAKTYVNLWIERFNRSQSPPNRAQADELRSALDACPPALDIMDARTRREFDFILRTVGVRRAEEHPEAP